MKAKAKRKTTRKAARKNKGKEKEEAQPGSSKDPCGREAGAAQHERLSFDCSTGCECVSRVIR